MEVIKADEEIEQNHPEKIYTEEVNIKSTTTNHILKKRSAFRLPQRKNNIYVTRKSNIKAQLRRCEKLFDSDETEIFIHGLGIAVDRAIKVALILQKNHHGTLGLHVKSSTVDLIDDLIPQNDEADYEVKNRRNSAIHIRVYQKAAAGKLRYDQSN